MAGGPLQWVFEIFDKLSAPSAKMEKATASVEKSMRAATAATEKSEKAAQASGMKWTEFSSKLHLAGVAARAVGDVIGGVARKVWGLAEQMGELQSERMSFEMLLGKKGGGDVIDYLDRVAKHTQFTDDQLRKLAHPLAMQGFGIKEISKFLPSAADVGALVGGKIETQLAAASNAMQLFASVKATGRLTRGAYETLGLTKADVFSRLTEKTGFKGDKLMGAMEGGKIPAAVLIESLRGALAAKVGTSGLAGEGAIKSSKSILALLEKISDAPSNAMDRILGNPATAASVGRIFEKILDVIDRTFDKLGGLIDEGKITKWLDTVPDKIERLAAAIPGMIDSVVQALPTIIKALETVGAFADKYNSAMDTGGKVVSAPFRFVGGGIVAGVKGAGGFLSDTFAKYGVTWGEAASKGFAQAFKDRAAGIAAGESITGGAEQSLGIKSPSRVFARLGRYTVAGFVEGIAAGSGAIENAYATAFAPDVPARGRSGAAGGTLGSMQIGDVIVNVGAAPSGASPREFAEMVGDVVESKLEEFAVALGVAS